METSFSLSQALMETKKTKLYLAASQKQNCKTLRLYKTLNE